MAVTGPRMTEEEFMRLPEDGHKYELVDGEPKPVPTTWKHDAIIGHVIVLLSLVSRGLGFVAASQAGFRMRSGNIRCPDASFTRKERIPGDTPPDAFGDIAPDICVEVISPSEDQADMKRKVSEYFGAGAAYVWQLFPENREIRVYIGPESSYTLGPDDEITAGDVLPAFRHKVAELFELE